MAQEPIGPAEGEALRRLREFVAHLWDECHDGGDFERTSDAQKLDTLLAPLSGPVDASGEPELRLTVNRVVASMRNVLAVDLAEPAAATAIGLWADELAAAVPSSPAQDKTPSLQLQAFSVTVKPLPPSSPVADSQRLAGEMRWRVDRMIRDTAHQMTIGTPLEREFYRGWNTAYHNVRAMLIEFSAPSASAAANKENETTKS